MNIHDWRPVDTWLTSRIEQARKRLEGDLDPVLTAKERGRLHAFRQIQKWAAEGFSPDLPATPFGTPSGASFPPALLTGSEHE